MYRQWRAIAQGNFEAASRLRAEGSWRSSSSRAYYAAFALVTGCLIVRHIQPRADLGTWPHAALSALSESHLLDRSTAAANLASAVRRLYHLRVAADYRPDLAFASHEAFEALGLMGQVFRQLKQETSQ